MPNYFATYGTFRSAAERRETPGFRDARPLGRCLLPGRLYQMGGYPVMKYGGGQVVGELLELPWTFDFRSIDIYEDYNAARPDVCRYVRRRVRLLEPRVEAWVYIYVWPADQSTYYPGGDWLEVMQRGLTQRRYREDRRRASDYLPPGVTYHK
jgi:gamma-glutamylcyclotransferase (GGCT)/AIG2-like uncharacterized protein YtfP